MVSEQQVVFVAGRTIQDNILVAHEAFHGLRTKTRGKVCNMAVELNLNKAYDRVEWSFLENVMR